MIMIKISQSKHKMQIYYSNKFISQITWNGSHYKPLIIHYNFQNDNHEI